VKPKDTVLIGIAAGLVMGVALFIAGAVAGRVVYGPQMAPEGKFEPEQLNALYFFWTKLLIGAFFGVLLSLLYESLPLSHRIHTIRQGVTYALSLWLILYLWGLSHPLVYGTPDLRGQLFWLVYTLGGFAALGAAFAYLRQRLERRAA
jgi:hypothetical protein